MAYFPSEKNVKTAITDHCQLPIHAIHQTTTDLFHWRVSRIIEVAPRQHYKFNYGSKGILMPMPSPTIGVITQYNRWFWVPMRTINPRWNDFQANNLHNNSDISTMTPNTVPTITIGNLVQAIRLNSIGADAQTYDFTVEINGQVNYHALTRKGKNMLTLLRQLGYKFNMKYNSDETVSAQPLLAAARIYLDYYYNNNYKNSTNYNDIIKLLKYDSDDYTTNLTLSATQVTKILDMIMYCYYDSAWDIDAWDNPNSPNLLTTLANNNTRIEDQEGLDSYVRTNNGKTFMASEMSGSGGVLVTSDFSQYTVNMLKQLQAYIKRNQLSGNDTAKRYLAQWGIQLKDEINTRSKKISEQKLETQIWRVESNSDTAQAGGDQLGSFAGNGEINGAPGHLDFQADEYGYLIEITTVIPRTFTDLGMDPIVLHKTRYDFLQPDFDGIGCTPILKQNIITTLEGASQIANISQQGVFGFLPRYWEYKIMRDKISGDYEYNTTKAYYESWTLHRELRFIDPTDVIHDENYTKGTDWNQFNRIFYYYEKGEKSKPEDRINMIHWLEGELSGNFKSLYDDYNFDENHHKETVQV